METKRPARKSVKSESEFTAMPRKHELYRSEFDGFDRADRLCGLDPESFSHAALRLVME